MSHPWALSFLGLPAFLSYFGVAMLLLLLFGLHLHAPHGA